MSRSRSRSPVAAVGAVVVRGRSQQEGAGPLGLRERYETLGPEGSFFFCRAMGFVEDEEEGELDVDLV